MIMDDQNWMEKIGIVKDLGEIKTSLARIEAGQAEVTRNITILQRTVFGEGSEPGLSKIVDRLNESEKGRASRLAAIWVAILSLSVKAVWDLFFRYPR